MEDLRETAILLGDVDDTGRIVIDVPGNCSDLYNQYGESMDQEVAEGDAPAEESEADAG